MAGASADHIELEEHWARVKSAADQLFEPQWRDVLAAEPGVDAGERRFERFEGHCEPVLAPRQPAQLLDGIVAAALLPVLGVSLAQDLAPFFAVEDKPPLVPWFRFDAVVVGPEEVPRVIALRVLALDRLEELGVGRPHHGLEPCVECVQPAKNQLALLHKLGAQLLLRHLA